MVRCIILKYKLAAFTVCFCLSMTWSDFGAGGNGNFRWCRLQHSNSGVSESYIIGYSLVRPIPWNIFSPQCLKKSGGSNRGVSKAEKPAPRCGHRTQGADVSERPEMSQSWSNLLEIVNENIDLAVYFEIDVWFVTSMITLAKYLASVNLVQFDSLSYSYAKSYNIRSL